MPIAEVSAKVAQAQTIVLAEYRSLKVGEITVLRAKARPAFAPEQPAPVLGKSLGFLEDSLRFAHA